MSLIRKPLFRLDDGFGITTAERRDRSLALGLFKNGVSERRYTAFYPSTALWNFHVESARVKGRDDSVEGQDLHLARMMTQRLRSI